MLSKLSKLDFEIKLVSLVQFVFDLGMLYI